MHISILEYAYKNEKYALKSAVLTKRILNGGSGEFVGWVERSVTQHLQAFVGFRCRYTQPTISKFSLIVKIASVVIGYPNRVWEFGNTGFFHRVRGFDFSLLPDIP